MGIMLYIRIVTLSNPEDDDDTTSTTSTTTTTTTSIPDLDDMNGLVNRTNFEVTTIIVGFTSIASYLVAGLGIAPIMIDRLLVMIGSGQDKEEGKKVERTVQIVTQRVLVMD